MTVFVATRGYDYEGETVVGVGLTFGQAAQLLVGKGGDSVDIREYEPGVPDPVTEFTRLPIGWHRKVLTSPAPWAFEWVPVGPEGT